MLRSIGSKTSWNPAQHIGRSLAARGYEALVFPVSSVAVEDRAIDRGAQEVGDTATSFLSPCRRVAKPPLQKITLHRS